MNEKTERDERRGLSRRELLKRAGLVGAASVLPAVARAPLAWSAQEAYEILTADESETLEAIVARLIPTDESGPGAVEARAVHYIDRALGGPLASSRELYAGGLEAVNVYARAAKGAPFRELTADAQDAVLSDLESDVAHGFTPSASAFFELLLKHTMEGTFSDPYYGGNANFVGWDLIGYPGVRTLVKPEEQRMDAKPTSNHKSAYDYQMFTKRRD